MRAVGVRPKATDLFVEDGGDIGHGQLLLPGILLVFTPVGIGFQQ